MLILQQSSVDLTRELIRVGHDAPKSQPAVHGILFSAGHPDGSTSAHFGPRSRPTSAVGGHPTPLHGNHCPAVFGQSDHPTPM
ncbi:hypothetical protein D8W71_03640 [Rhodococcus sp. P1Y]|nr:hypothetical protein D8W71_03640 [Rhodococcus sp. P1Y]